MYYSIQDFIENGIANLEECEKSLMKNPLNWTDQILGIQQILRKFGAAVISELLEECNTILENSIKRRAFWRIKDRTKKHLLTSVGMIGFISSFCSSSYLRDILEKRSSEILPETLSS